MIHSTNIYVGDCPFVRHIWFTQIFCFHRQLRIILW